MKIILNGVNSGKEVDYDPSLHVELSDGFYEKNDSENVVLVDGRYYRKNSPLVTKLSERLYGKEFYAKSKNVVKDCFTGELIHVSESISIDDTAGRIASISGEVSSPTIERISLRTNKTYYKTSFERILLEEGKGAYEIYTVNSHNLSEYKPFFAYIGEYNLFIAKSNTFILHPSYREDVRYIPNGVYVRSYLKYSPLEALKSSGHIVEIDGDLHWKRDIVYSIDEDGNEYKPILNRRTSFLIDKRKNPYSRVSCLQAKVADNISQAIETESISMVNQIIKRQMFSDTNIDSDFSPKSSYKTSFGFCVSLKRDYNLLEKMYAFMLQSAKEFNTQDVMSLSGYLSSNEKFPKLFTNAGIGNQGGDYVYFNKKKSNHIGNTFESTGGVDYTFGVEIETEKGVTPYEVVRSLGVDAVGDRSIGSLEYVTGVLAGDSGMAHLDKIVDAISDYAIVSDTCGIHVHIGGHKLAGQPNFDRRFSVLSVMLGCQIEKELFSLLPPNRRDRTNSNGQSYCASILDYSDINLRSWKKKLFNYVMGRNPEDSSESFKSLDEGISSRHVVGRWASSRYKWLNLVNCLTDNSGRRNGGGFQTIEFRAFNGTLNKDDVRAFVLISLAFTRYVEVAEDRIVAGKSSLMDVLSILNKESFNFMSRWVSNRRSLLDSISKEKQKTIL